MLTKTADQASATQDQGLAPAPLEGDGSSDFNDLLKSPGGQNTSKPDNASSPEDATVDPSKPVQTISKPAGKEGEAVMSPAGTTPAGTSASAIDPKVIEEIVAASTRGVQKATAESATATAQQKRDAQTMTPEQFNAKYQIRSATVDDIKALLDQDPNKAVAALNELLISNARTAVLMANDVFQAQLKTERANYEPHVKSWIAAQAKQAEDARQQTFYTKYPDLVNEKELVNEMIDSLKAKRDSGQVTFSSDEQAFEAVAAASRKLLARMNTQAAGSSGTAAPTKNNGQSTSSRQMATLSTAGKSGTGQATAKSAVEEVFGADAR